MAFVKRSSSTPVHVAPVAPGASHVKGARRDVPADRSSTSKYCDVCYGVGKSFEEYTSHYVKSKVGPDGIVTCPTILNSICTYCKTKGHFKSACEVLKKKNKMVGGGVVGGGEVVGAGGAHKKSNEKKRCRDGNMIHTNTYKCLFIGDDDGDSSEDETLEDRSVLDNSDFPPIPPPLVRSQTNKKPDRVLVTSLKKMSYADALESAVKTFPSDRGVGSATGTRQASSIAMPCSEEALVAFIQNKPPALVTTRSYNRTNANGTRKSWADSDSEYGSDEDEE
jgi:hypothetical protein